MSREWKVMGRSMGRSSTCKGPEAGGLQVLEEEPEASGAGMEGVKGWEVQGTLQESGWAWWDAVRSGVPLSSRCKWEVTATCPQGCHRVFFVFTEPKPSGCRQRVGFWVGRGRGRGRGEAGGSRSDRRWEGAADPLRAGGRQGRAGRGADRLQCI